MIEVSSNYTKDTLRTCTYLLALGHLLFVILMSSVDIVLTAAAAVISLFISQDLKGISTETAGAVDTAGSESTRKVPNAIVKVKVSPRGVLSPPLQPCM